MRLHPPRAPGSLPEVQRLILVGTPRTITELQARLLITGRSRQIVGCYLSSPQPQFDGCRVLGDLDQWVDALADGRGASTDETDLVLVSVSAAMAGRMRKLTQALDQQGIAWRWIPPLADELAGRVRQSPVADAAALPAHWGAPPGWIDPVQLLDRSPAPLDEWAIRSLLACQTVLITGAGGSIGSELARLVGRFGPARLVLVERAENALFEIDRQIARLLPDLPRDAVLHDVTDAHRTRAMVKRLRPDIIFHAAAHKHVPMMEDHPAHAVENNFYGTRRIADAAAAEGVKRFVMISTDKAVNPSSVMGASKRLAELYIQHLNAHSSTLFCMVRFGNVLGSACSVLPIWMQQIASGSDVTVTHPDMQRYFMTIPEAAGLVIQSAALTGRYGSPDDGRREGGEVFLLDMGEPVRIVDLAERFIRAHGLEVGRDVQIRFTGIRPGEKLFEELAYAGEDMIQTDHAAIHLWQTTPPAAGQMQRIIARFDALRGSDSAPWQGASSQAIHTALRASVPEMVVPASSRSRAAG